MSGGDCSLHTKGKTRQTDLSFLLDPCMEIQKLTVKVGFLSGKEFEVVFQSIL